MFIQVDIPENLSNKLTILKGQLNLRNKQTVILHIIEKFEVKKDDITNKQ